MKLAERLKAGDTLLTAWSGMLSTDLVEALAATGYDTVTLDMQHGAHNEGSVYEGIPAILRQGKPAVVRIPVGRNDMASRAADFGAEAIIAPMINSVEEARAFAAAVKYPPVGERSWGPTRALMVHGVKDTRDYIAKANASVLTFAMIETRRAVEALDGILELKGIDGIFVGPSDFSISWTNGATVDAALEDMRPTIAAIAKKATAAGKYAATFALDPKLVPVYKQMGYRLIAVGTDGMAVAAGAAALIAAAQ
jgi:4-hydroxy-2-oxoheptanedioate aldolase